MTDNNVAKTNSAGPQTGLLRFGRIGVVGAGTIGVGVAQNLAQTGHRVILVDVSDEILTRAAELIARGLRLATLLHSKLHIESEVVILSRIFFTSDLEQLRDADLVIENITEDWSQKAVLYPRLDALCREDCIVAANTSAIRIAELGALTRRADRVIGIHFMNPVPLKRVVEVIRGARTSDQTLAATREFLSQMGKRAIVVADRPGFVSNRVLMLTINEAIATVQDNVATPRDVDDIFVHCFSHKMGPLATADLIGLDTVLRTLHVLCESYQDAKFRPCPLLRQMVDAGHCGRKSGKGFFEYLS